MIPFNSIKETEVEHANFKKVRRLLSRADETSRKKGLAYVCRAAIARAPLMGAVSQTFVALGDSALGLNDILLLLLDVGDVSFCARVKWSETVNK